MFGGALEHTLDADLAMVARPSELEAVFDLNAEFSLGSGHTDTTSGGRRQGILQQRGSSSGWHVHWVQGQASPYGEHSPAELPCSSTSSSSQEVRRVRRPKRTFDFAHLYSYNTSGVPQLTELLDLIGTRDYQKQHHVLGVLAQEHQRRGVRYDLLVEQLWRNGWSMVGSQATSGAGGGDSAGTAILSLKGHAPVGKLEGIIESPDISPPDGPGRITAGFMSSTVSLAADALSSTHIFMLMKGFALLQT